MNDQTLFSIFFSAMVVNNFTLAMFFNEAAHLVDVLLAHVVVCFLDRKVGLNY